MRFSCAALAFVLATLPAAAQEDEIRDLVADLGADEFQVREEAMTRLEAIGEPALVSLEEATASNDAEVSRRAKILVQKIRFALLDREGVWKKLVEGNPWSDTRAFAGATVEFHLDAESRPMARWTVHGSGRPILSQEEIPVELDGRRMKAKERAFTYDAETGVLLDAECVAFRMTPNGWQQPAWNALQFAESALDRREALWAMRSGEFPAEWDDMSIVTDLFRDPDPEVRAYAAFFVGWHRNDRIRQGLRELLKDPEAIVRREAVEALGRGGEPQDAERIRSLTEDPDDGVKRHARAALEALEKR
ncbi:MAG: HEAT repeat domain-containing protein [Planctomycetes bacterium]|nr:HEAT repeat domain-containing protein [Planctomycetota bacterium]